MGSSACKHAHDRELPSFDCHAEAQRISQHLQWVRCTGKTMCFLQGYGVEEC